MFIIGALNIVVISLPKNISGVPVKLYEPSVKIPFAVEQRISHIVVNINTRSYVVAVCCLGNILKYPVNIL